MKMLPRVLVLLALYSGSAATAFATDPLDEVRRSFTIGGKPIPPEIFADFGDAMMSDNRPIVVTIDANAAIDSNRYADPIKTNGRWVEQIKLGSGSFNGPETMSYEFRGGTANGNVTAKVARFSLAAKIANDGDLVCAPSVSAHDHPAHGVALPSFYPQLPRC
jgi:hypothetical protein